ncbi:MAG: chemotaxis protein CheC [Myxococcota bacterium]
MTTAFDGIDEAEIDRLRELAHIGASWAASAFARLAGRTMLTRVPLVHGPDRFRKRGDWETGIFCEISGGMAGMVVVFLPATTRRSVVSLLCGAEDPPAEMVASALSEFGNILASQTVSAIADTLGMTILPGLPELVVQDAETALQARMSPRHRPPAPLYIESEIFDRAGEFRAMHVFLPDIEKLEAAR